MRERIAWFTPFNNKSSIARDSENICREIINKYDIDIWTSDKENLRQSSLDVVVFDVDADYSDRLKEYNHIVYCMGNFAGYHKDLYKMSKKYPGIMLLHDQTYRDFFVKQFLMPDYGGSVEHGADNFIKYTNEIYGKEASSYLHSVANDDYWSTLIKFSEIPYDFINPVIENAKGIFSHAAFFERIVGKYTNVPYSYAYLPRQEGRLTDNKDLIFKYIKRDKNKLLIASTGTVHPIKRIDKVVKVLRENPHIAAKVQYVIVGDYGGDYGNEIKAIADSELKGCLYLLGYQPDGVMESAIGNADLCINLRYPNSEVFSMSLAEQMSYGKPVLVIGNGVYGELPDDVLVKIDLDKEEEMIRDILAKAIKDKNSFQLTGKKAKDFVVNNFTAEKYAKKFCEFLKTYQKDYNKAAFTDNIIDGIFNSISALGFNDGNVPLLVSRYSKIIGDIFNDKPCKNSSFKTMGVWIGFLYNIPNLKREGVTIWMRNLVAALMEHKGISVELWGYACNEKEIRESFDNIFSNEKLCSRIKVIHENNWQQALNIPVGAKYTSLKINPDIDNLNVIAREYSKASCFMPIIIYLDSVVGIDKPIIVPAHDMAVSDKYFDFIKNDLLYKSRMLDISSRAENLARSGAKMHCISRYVRDNQVLKYIKNLYSKDSTAVYVPVTIPADAEEGLLSEIEVRNKFNLEGRYMFYATQNRPYKNILVTVKALNILKKEFPDLKLVMTGNPNDVPELVAAIKQFGLENRVIRLADLTNKELYSVYKYADTVPVSSVFEGGFPLQACEALRLDVPLALARTPFAIERIEFMGFTEENSGISIFNPHDEKELADILRNLLLDKPNAVAAQRKMKERMLSYTWKDVADIYYKELFG